jgi:hypothetical protein
MISGQGARAGVGRPRHVGIGDWVGQPEMASIERTAYPRFKRLITARELQRGEAGAGHQGPPARVVPARVLARTGYWIEWWRRFGPASGHDPKLKDPFGRYVITTFVNGTNLGPYEAAGTSTG